MSTLLLSTSTSVAPGNYQIDVVGKSGQLVSSIAFQLTVQAAKPATYAMTFSASSGIGGIVGGTTDPPSGTHIYAAGQLVTIHAVPSSGWSFSHWLVDGRQAGNGTELSFMANENMDITPVFSQAVVTATPMASVSFLSNGENSSLIVIDGNDYVLPTSFNWAIGSSHTVSVQSVSPVGAATELIFVGWQGGLSSSSSALSFTVKNDMMVVAAYQVKYLVSLVFVDPIGAVVSTQNATLSGPKGLMSISSGNSSIWLDGGSKYTLVAATTHGVSVTPLLPEYNAIAVTKPETITIPLSMYPVSIRLIDAFVQPISGASVSLTTEGGELFSQVTDKNGTATFTDVPMGWFDATYSYLGVSGTVSNQATGAHDVTVTMALSYPLVAVVAIFVAGFAIAIARAKLWKGDKVRHYPVGS
jgi:Divergent InlB B-repeat domain